MLRCDRSVFQYVPHPRQVAKLCYHMFNLHFLRIQLIQASLIKLDTNDPAITREPWYCNIVREMEKTNEILFLSIRLICGQGALFGIVVFGSKIDNRAIAHRQSIGCRLWLFNRWECNMDDVNRDEYNSLIGDFGNAGWRNSRGREGETYRRRPEFPAQWQRNVKNVTSLRHDRQ